jgi:hypothetical protein
LYSVLCIIHVVLWDSGAALEPLGPEQWLQLGGKVIKPQRGYMICLESPTGLRLGSLTTAK